MTIIYFLSPTGVGNIKKCLQDYLQYLKNTPPVFFC